MAIQISKETLKVAQAGIRYGLQLIGLYYSTFRIVPVGFNREGVRFSVLPRLARKALEASVQTQTPIFARRGTTDLRTLAQIFVNEQYGLHRLKRSSELDLLYESLCARGTPLIIDAGANCGYATRYFRGIFPAALSVAIEPDRDNFNALLRNTQGDDLVRGVHAGVAAKEGWLSILDESAKKNAIRTKASDGETPNGIKCITIERLLSEYGSDRGYEPFILKIDIEGFESDLFSGDTDWIDRFPIVFIELHDWMLPGSANSQSFLQTISKFPRDFILAGDTVVSIRNG